MGKVGLSRTLLLGNFFDDFVPDLTESRPISFPAQEWFAHHPQCMPQVADILRGMSYEELTLPSKLHSIGTNTFAHTAFCRCVLLLVRVVVVWTGFVSWAAPAAAVGNCWVVCWAFDEIHWRWGGGFEPTIPPPRGFKRAPVTGGPYRPADGALQGALGGTPQQR